MSDRSLKDEVDDLAYGIRFCGYSIIHRLDLDSEDKEHTIDVEYSNSKSGEQDTGGETMTDLSEADDNWKEEMNRLEEALEENSYGEAREAMYDLGSRLGVMKDEFEEVEDDYDDIREATYAMMQEVADRIQGAYEQIEGGQQEYDEFLEGLETLREDASDLGISEEHRQKRQEDDEFINRYLGNSETEE